MKETEIKIQEYDLKRNKRQHHQSKIVNERERERERKETIWFEKEDLKWNQIYHHQRICVYVREKEKNERSNEGKQ